MAVVPLTAITRFYSFWCGKSAKKLNFEVIREKIIFQMPIWKRPFLKSIEHHHLLNEWQFLHNKHINLIYSWQIQINKTSLLPVLLQIYVQTMETANGIGRQVMITNCCSVCARKV